MTDWIGMLDQHLPDDAAVLVSVVNVRGSAPREAGARMLVTGERAFGTIGGGQLEFECISLAATALAESTDGNRAFSHTFPLGASCGQCCGGIVDILFERIDAADTGWLRGLQHAHAGQCEFVAVSDTSGARALVDADRLVNFGLTEPVSGIASRQARQMLDTGEDTCWDKADGMSLFYQRIAATDFNIALFGAGHVGSAVVAALAPLDCRIRWIDSRRSVLPAAKPPNVTQIETALPALEVAALPADACYLVMTHSHALDLEICHAVLQRRDARYCGLIGSNSKRKRFERLLCKQGLPERLLDNLTCPIGCDGIPGKKPQEIAIAVAAQLLQIRSSRANRAATGLAENVRAI